MKRWQGLVALGALAVAQVWAADWKEEVKEPVKHVFPAGQTTLNVDNINGSITVIGDGGNTMRVEGEKVIRAVDRAAVERAKRDVTLDLNTKDGVAQVYVNGPFRDGGRRGSENHGFHERNEYRNYEVNYNLIVRVPRNSGLELHNVNGSTRAEETSGKIEVHGVNGSVTLANVAGAGTVQTVNGAVTATFRESPKADLSFKTVNGKIDTTFPANFAANVEVKTMNGAAYTDFETVALGAGPGQVSKSDGRFTFKSPGSQRLRVGAGGPEVKFETLNGGIQIHKGK